MCNRWIRYEPDFLRVHLHSTGHAKRLNRLNQAAFFGTEDYSKEELIAEIGAAALVNHCGILRSLPDR
ncbi:MAG: hypothetical protein IKM26_03120 [Clostridia bacterium]|nr:hypothetical protein [Clostridia bacterium]